MYKKSQSDCSYQKRYFMLRSDGQLYHSQVEDKLDSSKYEKINLEEVERIGVINNDRNPYQFYMIKSNVTLTLKVSRIALVSFLFTTKSLAAESSDQQAWAAD